MNIPIFFNRKYIFKWSIFHCYVSLLEGNLLLTIQCTCSWISSESSTQDHHVGSIREGLALAEVGPGQLGCLTFSRDIISGYVPGDSKWPFWDGENVTLSRGCWWPPTFGDEKVTAWITRLGKICLFSPGFFFKGELGPKKHNDMAKTSRFRSITWKVGVFPGGYTPGELYTNTQNDESSK